MNCPECGARNTAQAPWCTQCLQPLTAPPPAPMASAPVAAPPHDRAADHPPGNDAERPFRTVDGEVEWRCPSCGTWNLLAVPTCAVCGRALASDRSAGRFADRVARARRPLWALALVGGLLMVGSVVVLLLALRGAGV